MKIIYEAFDGTQFDNEFDCEYYEWKLNHEESLKDLIFYDKDGKVMTNSKLSEDVYSKVMKIEVLSNYGVQALKDIADYWYPGIRQSKHSGTYSGNNCELLHPAPEGEQYEG